MRSKHWLAAAFLLCLGPPAHAQFIRGNEAEKLLIQNITRSNRTISLFGPWLKNQRVAEALRVAVVTRGVKVNLLAANLTAFEPGSYFLGLKLAGAKLSVISVTNVQNAAPFIILDERVLIRTTAFNSPSAENITATYISDPATVKSYLDWTRRATAAGISLSNVTVATLLMEERLTKEAKMQLMMDAQKRAEAAKKKAEETAKKKAATPPTKR